MDVPEPPDELAYEERMAWARRDLEHAVRRATACVPSSSRTPPTPSPPAQLTEIAALAREFKALPHIHAAENATEVATVEVRHDRRPVELLDSLGLLGPDLLLGHAVELTGPGDRGAGPHRHLLSPTVRCPT